MHDVLFLAVIVLLAVIFDFINGFHDTANAVATVVSTRVLSPLAAVMMSAGLNLLGALSGTAVAQTIGSGIVGTAVTQEVVAAALIGAICWNIITWYFGIPSSSSHALIGGLIGSGFASLGMQAIHWNIFWAKVLLPFLVSPIVGFLGAYLLLKLLFLIFRNFQLKSVNRFFRKSQLFSSAFMAYSHGSNDAQKTMGIITLALISTHSIPSSPFHVPLWVIFLSASAMAAGTAIGGWRIIRTMGTKIFPMEPIHGFAAETAAATVIEAASKFGFPLSTTHIISSSILGAGTSKRAKSVHWQVVNKIIQTWILTIPVCASLSFIIFKLLKLFL
jgi:PiT family inorganic phosphate transporter